MNLTHSNSPLSFRSFFVSQEGELWAWGSNSANLLLQITDPFVKVPRNPTDKESLCHTPFSMASFPCSPQDIQQISVAYNHMLVLTKKGEIYGWGTNAQGQLGLSRKETHVLLPKLIEIPENPKIVSVHCADLFSLALTEEGDVFNFRDLYNSPSRVPKKIPELSNVVKISTCQHTLALTKEGRVFAWGESRSGQLGAEHVGDVVHPLEIPFPEEISDIYAGGRHSMFLTQSGKLFTCGDNDKGQLGIGRNQAQNSPTQVPLEGVVSAACGWDHCLALTQDGTLVSWGNNDWYQLGTGNNSTKQKIRNHSIVGGGMVNSHPTRVTFSFPESLAWIGAGMDESMVITKHGRLYTWGANNNLGQGSGDFNAVSRPRLVVGIKFKLPTAFIEQLWKNSSWLFLGKRDEDSHFFEFPVEIIFNFVSVLLN
jgi:alpha-tubulin suppressor-like RCC1 family protein